MNVYLSLYNGEDNPSDFDGDRDEMGFNGPVLGPFEWVAFTYGTHIKLGEKFDIYIAALHIDFSLPPFDDNGLIPFLGSYYGDMCISPSDDTSETKTQKILNTPFEMIPTLINDPDQWVRNFAQFVLTDSKEQHKRGKIEL